MTASKSGPLSLPMTNRTGWRMRLASRSKLHARNAGKSTPKKVEASLSACSAPPGTVLDRGRHAIADERRLRLCRRDRPRRLHERERVHRVRRVQGELKRDHASAGVPDHVGA